MRLEPIIEMRSVMTGVWRRLGVHLFEGKLTIEDMEILDEESRLWHEKVQGKLVEMVIIFPSDAKMTSEERTRMTRLIKRWEHTRRASATVVLAQGLVGAMHRSVLTGIQLVVPSPHPFKVFGAIPDALRWLSPHVAEVCGPDAKPDALLTAVTDLAARFAARPLKG